ncbi:GrrA/OscA1 family cyclophane-containing rSAM-modified RiPP [Rhodopila sp.]|jgi:rSAM-associated Gly-rich repeat protein|uniref:GrrA/OscA1 family cyclophane-containing rSAM-modified RiPP n=1 Tax=Rhodopila sp. TaxID=2480087 RepID=UPI002CB6CB0D|nr:GrrA/OscA1 family cyclophane-containing rSAM-modified RiPP [Rhodopila sp.]HVZ09551.1 GrrA/OscA1 family cyclophane-containing rSAM-modified RiPP [Rhodopila sp.]
MSSIQRTIRVLATLLPLGVAGASAALAAAPGKLAADPANQPGVAARLAAIRSAVSQAAAHPAVDTLVDPAVRKAWWGNIGPRVWGNGGWRWPNGWRNGGWANGGWRNWGNGWRNGGWHNWGNGGWPNFWRNW